MLSISKKSYNTVKYAKSTLYLIFTFQDEANLLKISFSR